MYSKTSYYVDENITNFLSVGGPAKQEAPQWDDITQYAEQPKGIIY